MGLSFICLGYGGLSVLFIYVFVSECQEWLNRRKMWEMIRRGQDYQEFQAVQMTPSVSCAVRVQWKDEGF